MDRYIRVGFLPLGLGGLAVFVLTCDLWLRRREQDYSIGWFTDLLKELGAFSFSPFNIFLKILFCWMTKILSGCLPALVGRQNGDTSGLYWNIIHLDWQQNWTTLCCPDVFLFIFVSLQHVSTYCLLVGEDYKTNVFSSILSRQIIYVAKIILCGSECLFFFFNSTALPNI